MTLDEYGVRHFWNGGESDAGPGEGDGNDATAAAAASLGAIGAENAMESYGQDAIAGLPQDATVSPGGMTYGELAALDAMGFGQMTGVNPNNPTQSVEEALAAQNVHAFANVAVPALMGLAVPGFSTAMTAAQTIGGLLSGNTTAGQALSGLGLGVVANQLGITPGTLSAALEGNLGQVAANTAMGAAPAAISSVTGMPAGLASLGLSLSGLGQQGNQAVASTVNEALGITPTNAVQGSIAQAIDAALGTNTSGQSAQAAPISAEPMAFDFAGGYAPVVSGGKSFVQQRLEDDEDLVELLKRLQRGG